MTDGMRSPRDDPSRGGSELERGRDDATRVGGLRTTPSEVERLLRYEWWLNHGHDYPALYGDDGEMQCGACPMDFKRTPLPELRDHVFKQRNIARADG